MARYRDYYGLLGVAPDASAEDIKRAYRTKARTLHPDVNKAANAQQQFVDVGEAYEVLSDPQKRAAYDQLRSQGFRDGQEIPEMPPPGARSGAAGGFGGFGGFGPGEGFGGQRSTQMDPEEFSEFFQELFGGRGFGAGAGGEAGGGRRAGGRARGSRRTAYQERGEDIEHPLEVTLEEAYHGGNRRLQMVVPQVDADGRLTRTTRTIDVRIPSGVSDGTRIRLKGQGEPGSTPELAGDLYLVVQLQPHPRFTVEGRTVHLALPVAPWEAVLGASVPVPTLGGEVQLSVPAGTVAGAKLRLRGRGLPGEPPGDQIVTITIAVPATVSERERELYRQLAAASSFHPRAEGGR